MKQAELVVVSQEELDNYVEHGRKLLYECNERRCYTLPFSGQLVVTDA